ncbi:MAG: dicarboxylate/amino acid:cation symporter [Puniceicoccaceae bacterium]
MKTIQHHRLTIQILIGMATGILLGILINQFFSEVVWVSNWVTGGIFYVGGKIFVACLQLLVVPLVLVSLISGTAALDDVRKVGTIGLKTVLLYMVTTAIAITLALLFASLFRPGVGIDKEAFLQSQTPSVSSVETQLETIAGEVNEVKWVINQLARQSGAQAEPFEDIEGELADEAPAQESGFSVQEAPPLTEVLIQIFPTNPIRSMAEGNMLQIIVFAILFGLALTLAGESGQRVLQGVNDLNEVVMKLVLLLMRTAPFGVFCLVGQTFATQGFSAIAPLSKYFFLVMLVLLLHAGVTYSLFLKIFARLSPLRFLRTMWETQMFAFSTSSSNATIPVTLETVTERLGVHRSVASFTVPLGATINMDGTAIMQGVATVFIAQAWGMDLSLTDFLIVIVTATLASIGTAGVPGVGLVMLSMVLMQVGLPVEGIAIILGVDRLLDMLRTAVNITGDSMVSCVVGRWQNALDPDVFERGDP